MFDRAAGLVVEDVGFIYISDQARPRGSSVRRRNSRRRRAGGHVPLRRFIAWLHIILLFPRPRDDLHRTYCHAGIVLWRSW